MWAGDSSRLPSQDKHNNSPTINYILSEIRTHGHVLEVFNDVRSYHYSANGTGQT